MTFKESDLKAIGGLSRQDRMVRGIHEVVDLAVPVVTKFREALNRGYGIRDWWYAAQESCHRLREANSETALGFLLRKGVQVEANDWYQVTERQWQNYCRLAGSNALAEWYAPLYPSVIADRVQRGTPFPEGRIVGEDSSLVNQKFGLIEAMERELFDDDQTGQVRERAQRLGAGMGITESVWAASRFIGATRTYANVTVPASTYSTTNQANTSITTPFNTATYNTSVGNVASSAGQNLNMGYLKQAYTGLLNATDPLGNKIIVNPDTLLVSAQDAINGKLLLAEGGYPAVIGQSNTTAATAPVLGGATSAAGANQGVLAGFPGGYGSANPMAGMGIKLVVERFLTDWFWALGQKGRGIIFQERDPLEVIQEAPTTGSAFSADVYRFRSRRRFEVDWVGGGSRFWYAGCDSATTPPTGVQ